MSLIRAGGRGPSISGYRAGLGFNYWGFGVGWGGGGVRWSPVWPSFPFCPPCLDFRGIRSWCHSVSPRPVRCVWSSPVLLLVFPRGVFLLVSFSFRRPPPVSAKLGCACPQVCYNRSEKRNIVKLKTLIIFTIKRKGKRIGSNWSSALSSL